MSRLMYFLLAVGLLLVALAPRGDAQAQEGDGAKMPTQPKGPVFLRPNMASRTESFAKVVRDRAWQGTPISVAGKQYRRGLGVHAPSSIDFPLDGKYAFFAAVPGPDDAHKGHVEMSVLVDGVEVYNSGPRVSTDGKPSKAIRIPVAGAQQLTLIVTSPDKSRGGDHASWGQARLLPEDQSDSAIGAAHVAAQIPVDRHKIEPFLQDYCIDCHGPDKQRGQVRFDDIDWVITNNDSAQRWQDVLDQLNGGEMPPEKSMQPFDDEMSEMLDILTGNLLTARSRLTDHGGEIALRRLNRREYSETIRHLFGFAVDYPDIPEDGESTFDTIGSEQLFTSAHWELYLELGRKIAKESFRFNTNPRRPVKTHTVQPEERVTEEMREKLADLSKKAEILKAGGTWQEAGFTDEGQAQILLDQFDARVEGRRDYLALPYVDTGVYLSDHAKWVSATQHIDIRGEYRVDIHGGIRGQHDPLRSIVKVSGGQGVVKTLKMRGTPDKPETVSFMTSKPAGQFALNLSLRENMPSYTANSSRGYRQRLNAADRRVDPGPSVWIESITYEGPFYPEERPIVEQIMFPAGATGDHSGGKSLFNSNKKAPVFIEKFAHEAFRHTELDPGYLAKLNSLYEQLRQDEGLAYRDAMAEVMAIILASPQFLYIQENDPRGGRHLTNRELAVRLAYFLWSSPPDEELYAADLKNEKVLDQQIDRMLASPKSAAFEKGFTRQWAEFDRFDAITIDEREYHRFNEGVRHSAKQEAISFFATLLQENLPVKNLIDSDFVTINPTLAVHYGIDDSSMSGGEFQKVSLAENSPRGGLMTQTAFLTTGSNGERSSPVIRGALVMEKLLHDEPAPPPPNVPELGSASDEPRTNREMAIAHQEQAVCASCHKKMDVIGFGLENFDTTGRWRDQEQVGRKKVDIDPAGTLPDGEAFATVQEMKALLLTQEKHLAQGVVESILAYGLGRTIEFSDADDVEALLNLVAGDGYRLRDIVKGVAMSELFKRN